MIITILIFIAILGILVFVHELGHFLVAKNSGMKVDEFGFGFPPRLFGIQKIGNKFRLIAGPKKPKDLEHTVYSINAIPLGGFVKIVGENNEAADDSRSFINKPFFPRLLTLVAGVLMNVLLAWVLISVGYMRGLPVAIDDTVSLPKGASISETKIAVVEVASDSPASKAGLAANDIILKLDGQRFGEVSILQHYIMEHKGQSIMFTVSRDNTEKELRVTPEINPPEGRGPSGIVISQVGLMKLPWYSAIYEGLITTAVQIYNIGHGLVGLFTSGQGFKSLGGPAKIAQLTGQVANMGINYLIQFTAFLSLNLAVLNILPFPALDGGRVLFLLIEKIRGKRNNQNIEQFANIAGFTLLLTLMVFVTFNDIRGFGGLGHVLAKLIGK